MSYEDEVKRILALGGSENFDFSMNIAVRADKEIDDLKKAICIHFREDCNYLDLDLDDVEEPDNKAVARFIEYWNEGDWS